MKILLVKPKPRLKTILKLQSIVLMEPLELGYVAAAVPPGHEVRVLDQRLSRWADREFVRTLKKYQPDLVGLAELIRERGLKKRYFAWARSTTVNRWPELFRLWREVGLDAVFLGFEAIADADLAQIAKHSTVADNEKAHATLREMGIAVHAGFMVNADFSREDFKNLQEYMKRMPPAQITCTVYTPSPGSQAWYQERNRYICHPFDLHDCMHPLTPTSIPLREFYTEFGKLSSIGSSRNPLRVNRARFPLREVVRILLAAGGYARALRRAYRDY